MKRWLWRIILTMILAATFVLAAVLVVEAGGPFDPSDGWLYPAQRRLEEIIMSLRSSPMDQASQRIELAYRRLRDAEQLTGGPYEAAALAELEQAARDAVFSASLCSQSGAAQLRADLLALFEHISRASLPSLVEKDDFQRWMAEATQRLRQPGLRLADLADVSISLASSNESPDQAVQASPVPKATQPVQIDPRIVYFHPGSAGAKHAFYPLVGKHGELECTSCHPAGEFAGTGNVCESCHLKQKPNSHFPGSCEMCHAPTSWIDIHFQHNDSIAADCTSCHLSSKPANHYPGQCSACHTTSAWLPASFNHAVAQATDCAACHTSKRPTNHWNGQCSACHSTSGWLPATFNHSAAGATDCVSCHSGNRPANHWGGQCSACHSSNSWLPASFNHAAAGATDCVSCHINRRPANHYDGQCSMCHSTSGWLPANFNHSFPMNHGGANGQCAKCHPSGGSAWTCFTCHNQNEMDKKHNEKGIPDYAFRCLECHAGGREHGD